MVSAYKKISNFLRKKNKMVREKRKNKKLIRKIHIIPQGCINQILLK